MNTAIAARNTVRAPKRSAVQPLAGMKIASDSRYEVTASLSASGLVPISAAIAGSEVAMTVESMFSMNRATATISGTIRFGDMVGGFWAPVVGPWDGNLRGHVRAFSGKVDFRFSAENATTQRNLERVSAHF